MASPYAPSREPLARTAATEVPSVASEASRPRATDNVVPIVVHGSCVKLSIPLDGKRQGGASVGDEDARQGPRRHRRDSLERREALLKGKEGSRRRQRWENDRLLSNPWAQPPLPSDWAVAPTHPVRIVPYFLAPLWDERLAARKVEERERRQQHRAKNPADGASRVPQDLRKQMKRAKAAKGLLHDLEEEIRSFVASWETERRVRSVSFNSEFSDDDIVFIGRNGQMRDEPPSPKASSPGCDRDMVLLNNMLAEKLVFDAPVDDKGASFGRWLVHSIAEYYGLHAWSVTRGRPAQREAYVGIDRDSDKNGALAAGRLPTPLWGIV